LPGIEVCPSGKGVNQGNRLCNQGRYTGRKEFFDALTKIGFEVKSKDLQVFYGGHKKGDWDIGIAMDMIELAPKLDVAILVSGDGDFVPLVEHLRGHGRKGE